MPRIKKKGTSGAAKNYITRSQAVRKLQVSLPDFRRLCIFKGIYPREPRSKKKASKSSTPSTTFYYTKDIQYLLHEPLLNKFRDQKALAKKISKALGRNEVSDAARFHKNLTPKLRLDHIIKERYPTFVDALRDLDDALSMLFLFANLPSTAEVPPKIIAKCQRLTMEFEHFLIRTHALRKSFLSIKGIYYQATIQGQDILWLVPYKFVQRTGADVDYRIMATFVEFYTTLLGFVNFRLYTGIGLVYPPKFDAKSEEQGAELGAFQLEAAGAEEESNELDMTDTGANDKAQAEADKILALGQSETNGDAPPVEASTVVHGEETEGQTSSTTLDQFSSIDPTADALLQPSRTADAQIAAQLFEQFTFFLSRETPRHPLEFILKAFGCKRVGWDTSLGEMGAYCAEDNARITHQVVDRPDLPQPTIDNGDDDEEGVVVKRSNVRVPGRTYVQPQWIWDCVNAGQLQRPDLYAPGATLPPHLSPWVKAKKGEYDPTKPLAEQETAAEAEAAEDEDEDQADAIDEGSPGEEVDGVRGDGEARTMENELYDSDIAQGEGMDVALADSDAEESAEDEDDSGNDGFDGFSGEDDDLAQTEDPLLTDDALRRARDHQAELEAEAAGQPLPASDAKSRAKQARDIAQAKRARAAREADEQASNAKMMISRRKRKMYDKMIYSNAQKDEQAAKLRGKRRRIERGAADST
nr:pescadillo homolog [Quercus suber]POF15487.1 pescadillo like [Quercus suber]